VPWSYWAAFFALAFFVWALPVHYGARRILNRQEWALPRGLPEPARSAEAARLRADYALPIKWVPRLLAIACFVAIGLGLWLARNNLKPASGLPLVADAITTIEGPVRPQPSGRRCLDRVPPLSRENRGGRHGTLRTGRAGTVVAERSSAGRSGAKAGARVGFAADLLAAGAAVMTTVSFGLVFVDPFLVADRLPRALFLVFLLGAWVLGLTYLAALSHKLRAPVLLTLAFGLQLIATFSPAFHDVRALALAQTATVPAPNRQLIFAAAAERWMHANGCAPERVADCPSPIIFAGQGGASRAAFFTASVFGEMLDRSRAAPAVQRDFAQQVFALSTVSGSSVAAVMIRAALADADPQGPERQTGPCAPASRGLWFGAARAAERAKENSWRACLQKLTGGDFLSAGVRRARDPRPHLSAPLATIPSPWWQDRATLLERAWERRYDDLVTHNAARRTRPATRAGSSGRSGTPPTLRARARRRSCFLMAHPSRPAGASWSPMSSPGNATPSQTARVGVRSWLQEGYDIFEIIRERSPRAASRTRAVQGNGGWRGLAATPGHRR